MCYAAALFEAKFLCEGSAITRKVKPFCLIEQNISNNTHLTNSMKHNFFMPIALTKVDSIICLLLLSSGVLALLAVAFPVEGFINFLHVVLDCIHSITKSTLYL